MQVRYQAALRPEGRDYIRATLFAAENLADRLELGADRRQVERLGVLAVAIGARVAASRPLVLVEPEE